MHDVLPARRPSLHSVSAPHPSSPLPFWRLPRFGGGPAGPEQILRVGRHPACRQGLNVAPWPSVRHLAFARTIRATATYGPSNRRSKAVAEPAKHTQKKNPPGAAKPKKVNLFRPLQASSGAGKTWPVNGKNGAGDPFAQTIQGRGQRVRRPRNARRNRSRRHPRRRIAFAVAPVEPCFRPASCAFDFVGGRACRVRVRA